MRPRVDLVRLADGVALQALIPGVSPINATAAQIAAERRRRDTRHGPGLLPAAAGLGDQDRDAQPSLF
jgi:hypothetical protein